MKKRKLIPTILATIMLGIALTACNGTKDTQADNTQVTDSANQTEDNATNDNQSTDTAEGPELATIIEYVGPKENGIKSKETGYKDGHETIVMEYQDGKMKTMTNYKYDGDKKISARTVNGESKLKSTVTYTYEDNARIETQIDYNFAGKEDNTRERRYELKYDKKGNLIEEMSFIEMDYAAYDTRLIITYTYDKDGNLIKKEDNVKREWHEDAKTTFDYYDLTVVEYKYENGRIVESYKHRDRNDEMYGEMLGIGQTTSEYQYNEEGVLEAVIEYYEGEISHYSEYIYKE
jgi:hypothetical protein